MGSHTFSWAHPAQEVYVTGTFDNWSKSVKLEKHGDDVFRKTVDLPIKKIEYKFVVDGEWVTDSTARQETDESGILNNVVEASEIQEAPSSHSFLSSAAPQSSTAALAGQQPLEKSTDRTVEQDMDTDADREVDFPQETPGGDLPGAFPVTPMNDLNNFFAKPIPATEGAGNPIKLAPGEPVPHPSTLTSNTVQSTVRHDPELKQADQEEQAFGINPIPATAGIGNPIKLAPGEPVPHPSTFNDNTVQSTVRHDAHYGVSDTGAPVLPPVLDRQGEAEANGAAMFGTPSSGFGLPSSSSGLIPESSLPMGDRAYDEPSFTTSSVAPQSTTAQLAGQVPLEPRGVPEVVSESQEAAHVDPEASASPEAVREKSAVEDELKRTVSKDNSNTDSSIVPAAVAGGAATAGAVLIGGALLAKDKIAETYNKSTEPTPSSKEVPEIVSESQHTAHVDPEASASPEAVREKAAFEDELKHTVHQAPATSESGLLGNSEGGLAGKIAAGTTAAGVAAAGIAYAARDKAADAYESATGQSISNFTKEPTVDGSVPDTVLESQHRAHVDPEAAANPEAVREKTAFEGELLSEVHKAPATSESGVFGRSEQGIGGMAAAGTAAVAGAANATKDKAADAYQSATGQPTSTDSTLNESVPSTVLDSQEKAHVAPEASANPEAVHEKSAFEKELKSEVREAPATSESGVFGKSEQGVAGMAAAGTAAVSGAAYAAKDKAVDAYQSATGQPTSTDSTILNESVPSTVLDSQDKAHVAPEASANPEAVREKSAFENELKSEVREAPATSESGAFGNSEQGITGRAAAGIAAAGTTGTAAVAGAAYAAKDKAADAYESATTGQSTSTAPVLSDSSVPEVVSESQHMAHVAPEASANPEAVREKSAFENELKSEVGEAPATSESGAFGKSEQGITGKAAAGIAAGTAALGAGAAGVAYATREKAAEATTSTSTSNTESLIPPSIRSAIDNMNSHVPDTGLSMPGTGASTNSSVPEAVTDSQHRAHVAPEASAEPEVVAEKSQMEKELLAKVHPTNESSAPAPTESAALSAVAPVKPTSDSGLLGSASGPTGVTAVSPAPAPAVTSSMADPFTTPSSSKPLPAEPTSIKAKTPVGQLGTPDFSAPSTGSGLNASADSEAQTPATRLAAPDNSAQQSRDVSPMTRPDSSKQTEPTVTTGVETSTIPTTSAPSTPQKSASKRASSFFKNTPDSVRTTDSGASKDTPGGTKKKGFLAKLKDKFKS